MKLKEYIKKLDLTIPQFARRVGVNHCSIYNLIKGRDCRNEITAAIEKYTNGDISCQYLAEYSRSVRQKKKKKKID
jgi:predicted transcriptional regulator